MGELDHSQTGNDVAETTSPPNHAGDDPEMATSKLTKSPAFQFYPKEFLSSSKVIAMSATERGAYITLLSVQWLDGSLPNDLPALARLAGVAVRPFIRMWPHNLGRCFTLKNGRFMNERLERERKKQAEYRARQAEHGAKGGRPKALTHGKGSGFETESQTEAEKRFPISDLRTAISDLQSTKRDVRQSPIIARRRLDAAWEGPKGLYVPQRKHSDFIQLRDHPNAERELLTWYGEVAEAWSGSPGADMMKFWTARYDEKWPAPDSRVPAWAR